VTEPAAVLTPCRPGDTRGSLTSRCLWGWPRSLSPRCFISDLIEVAQGGFSTFRLILTYAGEAALPLFVIGLYAVQRPRIGRLGFVGAIAYAYSYVFFTSTVIYALISGIPNYKALTKVFGAMTSRGPWRPQSPPWPSLAWDRLATGPKYRHATT